MWPCVAVSEICCFQLARGLSKVAACPTTSHVPPPPPPPLPLHFLGSGFQPPQWDSSLGAGAPDWTFCEALGALRPPACLPAQGSEVWPTARCASRPMAALCPTLQRKLHSTPSTITQKCDSNPGFSASFRKFTEGGAKSDGRSSWIQDLASLAERTRRGHAP